MSEVFNINSAASIRFDKALNDQSLRDYIAVNFAEEVPEHLSPDQVERFLDMTEYELRLAIQGLYRLTDGEADIIMHQCVSAAQEAE